MTTSRRSTAFRHSLRRPATQEMKVHPAMLMKTHGGNIQFAPKMVTTSEGKANARSASPILTPDSCLLTPALQEMKVHPAMLMKTHNGEIHFSPKMVTRSRDRAIARSASPILTPDSSLPTSALHEMKVHSAMLMKTHNGEIHFSPKMVTRSGDTAIARGCAQFCLLTPAA